MISGKRRIGRLRLEYAEQRLKFVRREAGNRFAPGWRDGLKVASAAVVRDFGGNLSMWLP